MRYAILSDVHANVAALQAVLTDAADMCAGRIVCLGDVLGYGPEPVEALELVYRRAHVCLAGNHDDAVAGRYPVRDFTEFAAAAVLRHRTALAQKAIDWLRHLPHTCEFQSADGGSTDGAFACAHGEFYDPKHFDYILKPADALPSWRTRSEQLLFVGHTHKPGIFVLGESGMPHALEPMDFVLEPGKRYLVNVGSVGYPRSGACRSFYCIYDDHSRTVFFRSLPFDLDGYRRKMNGQGMEEAPWIMARAQELRPTDIRNTEAFGRPEKKKKIRIDDGDRPACRAPLQPPPRPAAARLGLALVVGAVLLALGGIWCTIWLTRALREERTERAAVQAVEVVSESEATPVGSMDEFAATLPLSSGWVASFEYPDCQSVQVDRNEPTKETVFRLTSETNGVVRFTKQLSFFARPPKVYYTVRMLTTRQRTSRPFKFTVRVVFRDAAGRQVGEDLHTAFRSVSNHSVKVPENASMAELRIDCLGMGTHDLAIPDFKTEPIQSRTSKRHAPITATPVSRGRSR